VVWTPDATYRAITPRDIEVFLHSDHTTLICKDARFFSLGEKRFTIEAAPATYANEVEICRQILSIKPPTITERAKPKVEFVDGVKVESVVDGIGTFTAYNDRTMKGDFDDRTIVWFRGHAITVLTRTGDSVIVDRHSKH
jgi:hypothetical protein